MMGLKNIGATVPCEACEGVLFLPRPWAFSRKFELFTVKTCQNATCYKVYFV